MKKSKEVNQRKSLSLNKKSLMSLERNISANTGGDKMVQGGSGVTLPYMCTDTCGTCAGQGTCDITGCMTC
ncbi:MAG TPA: hypothetical protein VFU05_19610 [Cyclobacteriaceae bacterium]|nr:hypothetical protein [Cyclobacteriaceae bacterium]